MTDANYEDILKENPQILVNFYGPRCGLCKTLALEYSKAAYDLNSRYPPIKIAKCDGANNPILVEKFGVTGYPTLKYILEDDLLIYSGRLTSESLTSWILKKTYLSSPILASNLQDLQSALSLSSVAIVYFSPKNTDIFSELSKTFENIVFLYTYSNEILLNYGAVEDDIVMFKHFDEKKVDFGGKINRNSLQRWIQETSKPYVRPYDDETSAYVFEKLHPAIFFFRYEGEAQDYDDFFHKLAREFKDDLVFTYADLSLPEYRKLSQFMGVPRHAMPTFTIIDFLDDGLNKYLYFRAPNESDVKNFIIQWKNKEIKPFVKSEATPDKPYVNGVLTVVANTFEELVIDIDKDVLVEFWVPWSEMCRKIAKDYEELARTYQDDGNIIIARVDGNLNDVKGHYIQEYPTFKFFPRHQKSGILFTGDPSLAFLNQFILDHTQPNRRIDL